MLCLDIVQKTLELKLDELRKHCILHENYTEYGDGMQSGLEWAIQAVKTVRELT